MSINFPYKNILVVCSVNTARSPMVVGFLEDFFSKHNLDVNVLSGGIASNARDGMLISLDAKLVMKEEGINLPEESRSIDLKKRPALIHKSDLIITLTEKHKTEIFKFLKFNDKKVLTLKEFAGDHGDIEDPSMKGIDGFRKTKDEIKENLMKGLKKYM